MAGAWGGRLPFRLPRRRKVMRIMAVVCLLVWVRTLAEVTVEGGAKNFWVHHLQRIAQRYLTTAGLYYGAQRPKFLAAARDWAVHWAWVPERSGLSTEEPYEDLVSRRFEALARRQRQFGRDDALAEKDKCEMYRWLQRNNIPIAPLLGMWNNSQQLIDDIKSEHAFAKTTKWPVFLKCCHLTSGSAKSVMRLKSLAWTKEHYAEVEEFILAKFAFRATDVGRKWQENADKLTAAATPGLMLQGPAELTKHDEDDVMRIFEVKTQVYWGRAYFAELVVDNEGSWIKGRGNTVFLRGKDDHAAEYHNPQLWWSSILYSHYLTNSLPYNSWSWIVDEGHLQCIWRLSEAVAKILSIDHMRVDIFYSKGKPDSCRVNEISLSSGGWFGDHRTFMAKIWSEPLVSNHFQRWGDQHSRPAYMWTEYDLPEVASNKKPVHAFVFDGGITIEGGSKTVVMQSDTETVSHAGPIGDHAWALSCRLWASRAKYAPGMQLQAIGVWDYTEKWSLSQRLWREGPFLQVDAAMDPKLKKQRVLLQTLYESSGEGLGEEDLVMYLDGTQQHLFTAAARRIADKFEDMHLPDNGVLFMAERKCTDCGFASLVWPGWAYGKATCDCDSYPESPTSYRFLSTRAFIGRKSAVVAMLRTVVGAIGLGWCHRLKGFRNVERNCLNELYTEGGYSSFQILLDHRCEIFQSLWGTSLDPGAGGDSTGLGAARRNFSKEDQQGGAFFQGVEGRLRNPETGTHPAVLLLTDQGYTQARVGQNVREVLGDGLDAELVRNSKLIVRGSRSYHRVGDICEGIEDPATRERLFYAKSTCYARGGVASCRASEDAKVTWGRHPGRKERPT